MAASSQAVVTTLAKFADALRFPNRWWPSSVSMGRVGLEHHELALAASTGQVRRSRVPIVGQPVRRRMPVFGFVGLGEMVGPVALMCDQRLDQRVMKDIDVTGSHPPHAAG